MREILCMNRDWKFHLGEIPVEPVKGHYATYMHAKAQSGQKPALDSYYDGDFIKVDLPHDYVIGGEVSKDYNESQGSLERKNAWYRKNFQLGKEEVDRRVVLLFEGSGMKTDVWINGHFAGSNQSMYNSFYVDITPYVLYGKEINTIAVHIVNDDTEGWWYEGAGIYRNVYMIKTDKVAVDVWGTHITPTFDGGVWQTLIDTTVYSMEGAATIQLHHKICDQKENIVAQIGKTVDVLYGENIVQMEAAIEDPVLWSIDNPYLYKVITEIWIMNEMVDTYSTDIGFRTIHFDANKGFFLNGKKLKLRGACIHQDHGNLGVAVPKSVLAYRLQKLKDAGINAYRCAHHNPSPELFDLCNRMGILVIDENRWFNFSEQTKKQVSLMLKRDVNHPCIIVWSVGNEEPLQNTPVGGRLVHELKNYIKLYDCTRPVTIALNGGFFDSYAARESDIVGVNYALPFYDKMHEVHSAKAIVAMESSASGNNRGIYFDERYDLAYDKKTNTFGSSYLDAIRASETHDFIAGTFLWSGIEYRGEAKWPALISSCGILDNCCMEKDTFYIVKSLWTSEPIIHMMPHWSLQSKIGESVRLYIYTNVENIEININGNEKYYKEVKKYEPIEIETVYEPGYVELVGFNQGQEVIRKTVRSAEEPDCLVLECKNNVSNSGLDAVIVEGVVKDKAGTILPDFNGKVEFYIKNKAGRLLSVSNGDPLDHSNAKAVTKSMFSGRVQAIINVAEGAKRVKVGARIPEYNLVAEIDVPVTEASISYVKTCESKLRINSFRSWPIAASMNVLDENYNFDDMNTSEPITLLDYCNESNYGVSIFTARAIIPEYTKGRTLYLQFNGIKGKYKIKIFHDQNCWPYKTPDEFLTVYSEEDSIQLQGFEGNEKINIIICVDNTEKFYVRDVEFIVKE